MNMKTNNFRVKLGLERQQAIYDALASGEASIPQLMALTGLLRASAVLCIDRLHDKKKIHIAGFDPDIKLGWRRPIYAQGSSPDARPDGGVVDLPIVQQHWYSGLGL